MSQGTVIESDPLLVMPKTGELTIKIPKHAITRQNFTGKIPTDDATMNASGTFSTTLAAGSSYKLYVKLRVPKWAGSNIYWVKTGSYDNGSGDSGDVGYLTFDPYYVDGNDAPHKGYQGVFFKFGSLVGISPAMGSTGTTLEKHYFSNATPVYIPIYDEDYPVTGSTWKSPHTSDYTSAHWVETLGGMAENATETIPYMDGSYTTMINNRSSTYVSEDARNNASSYQGLRGDICRYLSTETGVVSGEYRLPTSYEFGTNGGYWDVSAPVAGGWMKGAAFTTDNTAGNAEGTIDLITDKSLGFVFNQTMGNVVFPASGHRNYDSGMLDDVGNSVLYWSSSSNSSTGGYNLRCDGSDLSAGSVYYRSYAFAVRCVVND
jgi:hypothetical protein